MSLTRTTSEFDASLQRLVGQTFFFYDPARAWELGTLLSFKRDPRSGLVGTFKRRADGEQVERSLRPEHVYCHAAGNERNNPDNLLALSELHHSLLINVLKLRHADDNVYTYLGDLVIAINPFKYTIPYYGDHMMAEYSNFIGTSEIPFSTASTAGPYTQFLRPHPWAVAHRAYVEMLSTNKKNHSVVISGESGAGKTETCKLLLKYLVHLSGRKLREEYALSSTSAMHGSPTSEYASPASLMGIENASLHSAPSFRRMPAAMMGMPSPDDPLASSGVGAAGAIYNSNNPAMMGSFAGSPSFAFTSTMNVMVTRELVDQREEHAAIINKRVQQADPILEAFGNAKTARNDNSSRFGKFMEVQFDDLGSLLGMRITPFLLEKSRVVHCGKDERSYHCFYQLLAGGGAALLSELRLRRAKDYPNLDKGNCLIIRGVDDAREFQSLVQAMTDVGLSSEEQHAVWKVLAAVLHLQTVEFDEHRVTSAAELGLEARATCEFVAGELLGLQDRGSLGECLVATATYVRQEKISKALTVKKAKDQRDSLCKYLYAKLFYWIVQRINEATMANSHAVTSWIGLLDIFGFEDMASNSFEQLCINLTNEVLQRNYTRAVFDKDVDDMRSEGISVEAVRYRDNAQCIELLQGTKGSILSFLDDASTLDIERAQTDPNLTFLHRITMEHRPDYQTQGPPKGTRSVLDRAEEEKAPTPGDYFLRGKLDDDSFTIRHYAGDVKYKVASFIEKNIDTLKESTHLALLTTTSELFKNIILTEEDSVGLLANSSGGAASPVDGRGAVGRKTAAASFRKSLVLLRDLLAMSVTHWVRCLRPHTMRQPGLFDGKVMLEQLVATGVLETVAQRQRNFPFRLRHAEFLDRFAVIAFSALRKRRTRMAANDKCEAVLVTAQVTGAKEAQVGSNKVFLSGAARQTLEDRRAAVLDGFVLTLQRYAHHYIAKETACFLLTRRLAIIVQRKYRQKLMIRRAIKSYYEAIWRRMEEEMAEARRQVYVKETRNRTLVEAAMIRRTDELYSSFRRHLAPLVAAVLVNTQLVESHRRIDVEKSSRDWWRAMEHSFAEELAAAERREAARLQREAEERQVAREYLVRAYEEGSVFIADDEATQRAAMTSQMRPVMERINRDAADVAIQMAHRDAQLAVLEAERAQEVKRLAAAKEARIASEEALWMSHIGQEAYRSDLSYLITSAGLTAEQCRDHMRSFYASKAATAVVGGSVLRGGGGVGRSDAASVAAASVRHRHGIGNVTSYRDYAAFMKSAYEHHRAVSSGAGSGGGGGGGSAAASARGAGYGAESYPPRHSFNAYGAAAGGIDASLQLATDGDFDEAVLTSRPLEVVVAEREAAEEAAAARRAEEADSRRRAEEERWRQRYASNQRQDVGRLMLEDAGGDDVGLGDYTNHPPHSSGGGDFANAHASSPPHSPSAHYMPPSPLHSPLAAVGRSPAQEALSHSGPLGMLPHTHAANAYANAFSLSSPNNAYAYQSPYSSPASATPLGSRGVANRLGNTAQRVGDSFCGALDTNKRLEQLREQRAPRPMSPPPPRRPLQAAGPTHAHHHHQHQGFTTYRDPSALFRSDVDGAISRYHKNRDGGGVPQSPMSPGDRVEAYLLAHTPTNDRSIMGEGNRARMGMGGSGGGASSLRDADRLRGVGGTAAAVEAFLQRSNGGQQRSSPLRGAATPTATTVRHQYPRSHAVGGAVGDDDFDETAF